MSAFHPTRREVVAIAAMAVTGSVGGWVASLLPPTLAWIALGAVLAMVVAGSGLVFRRLRRSTRRLDGIHRVSTARLNEGSQQLSAVSDQLDDVSQRLSSTTGDVKSLSRGLARLIDVSAGVADELYAIGGDLQDRTILTHEEVRRLDSQLERSSRHHDRLQQQLDYSTQRFATKQAVADAMSRAIVLHRLSALSDAYRLSAHRRPDRIIVLMTVERSGSTALFDLFRSHPDVYVEPLAFLWEELGFDGRRYPSSLSDQGRYTMALEVQPGIGARIPVLETDPSLTGSERTIAIEKAHPQFLDHDPERLIEGISRLQDSGTEVVVIVQVRQPLDVMWSMAEYKQREPSWYAPLDPVDIPEHVHVSLESLDRIAERVPGVRVIDNSDLTDVSQRLIDLVEGVVPIKGGDTRDWVKRTLDRLTAMQRGTAFMAERDVRRSTEGPESIWIDSGRTIEEATSLWKRLRER